MVNQMEKAIASRRQAKEETPPPNSKLGNMTFVKVSMVATSSRLSVDGKCLMHTAVASTRATTECHGGGADVKTGMFFLFALLGSLEVDDICDVDVILQYSLYTATRNAVS